MKSLHGITRHTTQGTEFLSRQTTEMTPHWTCEKKDALQINSRTWAMRMANRFGGTETVLRGALADHHPKHRVVRMAPYVYEDIIRQIADAWSERDADALFRALGHAVRRGTVTVQ